MTIDEREYREDDRRDDDIGARHRRDQRDVADEYELRRCRCGHVRAEHHELGPCLTLLEGRGAMYCACLQFTERSEP